MKGLVYKSTGSWYDVADDAGVRYPARVRGRLRLEGSKETNPVAVGDRVEFTLENNEAVISDILPRENHMLRQSVKKTGHSHVLAANVTQALLVATFQQPRTSLGFIDRFLVSAEAYRIPQVLVFNKKDLLDEAEQKEVQAWMALYEALGARTFLMTALKDDLDALRACLANHTTLIAGHSGVGKSSLLNRLSPHIRQTVGDISSFSNKGIHTTTFAEMFDLDAHTKIIDTPGVKEWGLVNMTPEELSDYFPEMRNLRLDCKFGARCLHKHEPGCAVLRAVGEKRIAASRYHSYLSMVEGHDNRK
ncbi:MAG: ribosome small subunit-dependent GTPase A [Cyclobacteriaceae bacterium]|jgi:ribosome biogenesis GTPase|nr:ribosome small subunit-dependent GTPase A [Cyclobacteriaceae bacterium]